MNTRVSPQTTQMLLINQHIQNNRKLNCDYKDINYHMQHIKLVKEYALILNKRLNAKLNTQFLTKAALMHDILKEHGLDKNLEGKVYYNGRYIPQDLKKYISNNEILIEKLKLKDYIGKVTDHALSGALWVYNELKIKSEDILYPMIFHSCPIMEIYHQLTPKSQTYIDVIMLADKLSSNYLRIQMGVEVKVNLEKIVFGESGNEFNYSLGLYTARLIGTSKAEKDHEIKALDFYLDRLKNINPFISKKSHLKLIKEKKLWPKEKSKVLKI